MCIKKKIVHVDTYQWLSALFCRYGKPFDALYVVELGRVRALADLMSTQYSVETQMSANPETWFGIESIIEKKAIVLVYTFLIMTNVYICGFLKRKRGFFSEKDTSMTFLSAKDRKGKSVKFLIPKSSGGFLSHQMSTAKFEHGSLQRTAIQCVNYHRKIAPQISVL